MRVPLSSSTHFRSLRRRAWLMVALGLGLLFAPGAATAGAGSGIGLFAASASLVTEDAATGQEYGKATWGAGLDYQHALGESFSLGLSLAEYSGDAAYPTLPEANTHKVSTLELEARIWLDAFFVGYHGGVYTLVLSDNYSSNKTSDRVSGGGFTLGVEGEGGWFLAAQSVAVEEVPVPEGPLVNVEGYLLRLGYRWR